MSICITLYSIALVYLKQWVLLHIICNILYCIAWNITLYVFYCIGWLKQWLLSRGPHLLPDTATSAEQIYHIASFGSFFLRLLYITRSLGAQVCSGLRTVLFPKSAEIEFITSIHVKCSNMIWESIFNFSLSQPNQFLIEAPRL